MPRALRSQTLPFVVRAGGDLPALWLFPGHMPAQEASAEAEGNCAMLGPISAAMSSASLRLTPGIVASSLMASLRGSGPPGGEADSIGAGDGSKSGASWPFFGGGGG